MKRALGAMLAFLLGAGAPALAQTSAEGSLRGHVKDQQGGALAGVTLTATSPTVPGSFSATTDASGFYRLLNLPPGEYQVTAELTGFAKHVREGIVIRAGLNLGLELTLKVGALSETVTVKLETPMVESQTAAQALNIDGDFQRSMPVSYSNHWSNFLAVTPGVTGNQLASRTADSYVLRGSNFASHVIQVDGSDMAATQQNATLYLNFASEAIADVQVKTGAMDASVPLGVGAVVSLATKSGTNDFRGAVSATFQRKGWSDDNNPGGTRAALDAFLPEVAVGGPIVRDRLWFFGSYRYERIQSGIARSAEQIATLRAVAPGFEPFDSTIKGHYLFAKLTGRLSGKHHGELSYAYDPQVTELGGATDAGQYLDTTAGGDLNIAFRLSSIWRSDITTRFGASSNNRAFESLGLLDVTTRPIHGSVTPGGGRLLGTGAVAVLDNRGAGLDQHPSKYTLFGDVTYLRRGWAGSHELQAGFYYQPRNHEESVQRFANEGFAMEESVLRDPRDPSKGFIPFHREIWDVSQIVSALGDTRDLAFYLQDAWRPADRLTLSAGVRVDVVKRVDRLFDLVVQDSAQVGPRLGLNYAVTADRKNSVRASWVRVHDVLSINPVSSGSSTAGKRDLYDTDLNGSFETVFVTPPSTARATDRILDPGRRQPYINELTLGLRRQVPGRVTADLSFVRREYRSRSAVVDQNGIYENGVFKGYADERFNEVYQVTENKWNWLVYSGFDLQIVKDTSRLRFLGAYTRSWRHIAGTWQPNDPASFIQPSAFANDAGIGDVRSPTAPPGDANSLSGTSMTSNLPWQDHVARAGLVYKAPLRFVLATNYVFQSGVHSGPIVTRVPAADPAFGPATVTLSNGRRVSNPLATTLRFAYATRGDGQLKLAPLHIWNLRVGRDFNLGTHRSLELALDLFNVINADADQSFIAGGNQTASPNYGKGQTRQLPRSARLSARLGF